MPYEQPYARRDGAREGAPHVAEELALEEVGRDGPAVERYERAPSPRAGGVERLRHELLSRPGFPFDQHGDVASADARDQVVDPLHRGAGPNELADRRALDGLLAQSLHFRLQVVVLHRAGNAQTEQLHVYGFREKVVGPGAHRRDRDLHAPIAGHDDDGRRRGASRGFGCRARGPPCPTFLGRSEWRRMFRARPVRGRRGERS